MSDHAFKTRPRLSYDFQFRRTQSLIARSSSRSVLLSPEAQSYSFMIKGTLIIMSLRSASWPEVYYRSPDQELIVSNHFFVRIIIEYDFPYPPII